MKTLVWWKCGGYMLGGTGYIGAQDKVFHMFLYICLLICEFVRVGAIIRF